ncbi:receptor-like protein EIX2 [Impatiens glandulifera]|uniref:receptor-like protein EIX2 n=1 Tax=Impatiens glandulifera TaxID=253017 RepID=UPI001FB16AC8|nr:receptor-like protein EIX2 [Impatiens glandulifera]
MANFKILIEFSLLVFICCNFLCSVVINAASCLHVERNALLSFKDGLDDPSGRLSSWVVGVDCCKWEGVDCDEKTGRVVSLKLQNPFPDNPDAGFGLTAGNLNSSLASLKQLGYLDLSMNNFGGISIPGFFGSFEKLRYLNLSGSSFGGTFPPQLGNLTDLVYLDLSNSISDQVANDLNWISTLSSLKHLNMGNVNLNLSAHNWLENVNMLPSLIELHLPNCALTNLPPSLPLVNLTSLSVLELSSNGFVNSTFPTWLFNLSNLTYLNLYSNGLQGTIPDGISSLKFIEHIDLSFNGYIMGKLPKDLGNLCNLRKLLLSGTQFEGEIGDLIDGFSSCVNTSRLEELDLGYNQLGGFLPKSLGRLSNLKYLTLSDNSFLGDIPESIGNLSSLVELSVSNNQMNGSVPESLGKLSALSVLDLSKNPWNGVITEMHFLNLSSLKQLSIMGTTPKINFVIDINPDWIPPFRLEYIDIKSCQVGPRFPSWLRNQNKINYLVLKNTMISDVVPDWFLNLNLSLRWFELAYNNLSGEVPNRFVFEEGTFLDLGTNRFEGPLPMFSSNISTFYLSNNLFHGTIPANIGQLMPMLTNFDVTNNSLHGIIPASFGEIQTLTSLQLSRNNFSGEIPDLIWEGWLTLYIIDLSFNKLTGKIPSSIGTLSWLMFLSLSNNKLDGQIPPSLQNCTKMKKLDLENNMFTGQVPSWIGEKLSILLILKLRSNRFNGGIPKQLCGLSDLHILDLAQNGLSGTIPLCLSNLTGMATEIDVARYEGELNVFVKGRDLVYKDTLFLVNLIDFSDNNLSGSIPNIFSNLSRLGSLNLSSNHLTGEIPDDIGSLYRLETLDLSRNQLSGPISVSLASMTALNHLNLSYNDFSGRIPTSNQFNTFDSSTYMNNPRLCGRPLTVPCAGDPDQTSSPPTVTDDEEEENWFEMRWFIVSMVLGFTIGFWGFFGTLIIKQSWRICFFGFVDEKLLDAAVGVRRLRKKLKSKRV